jgi:hypothetical protein
MRVRSVVVAIVLLGSAPLAFAQAYKWVDDKGVTHYGDKPPAQSPATQVAPSASSGPSGSSDAPRGFGECRSQACEKVSRVDPTCRTSLCREAMSLPDDCHTITCQGKRAELDKRIGQMDPAKRGATAQRTPATAPHSGEAASRARAQERCKANRGVDCESAQGLAPWIREERPITSEQQQRAAAARRARGN